MSAIEAAAIRCRTMADGSLRIECEIEPRHAQAAFVLFGAPGTAMALAALKPAAKRDPAPMPDVAPDVPKGGPLAKLAGMWCQSATFQKWMGFDNAEEAASAIRETCRIGSRAELDNNPRAAELFNRHIRGPYSMHLISIGVIE